VKRTTGSFIINTSVLAAADREKRRGAKRSLRPSPGALRGRKKRILDKYPAGAEISAEDRELNEIECWKRDPRLMRKLKAKPPKFVTDAMIEIERRELEIKKLQQEIASIRKRLLDRMRYEFSKNSQN
jgi:hypothetical protein